MRRTLLLPLVATITLAAACADPATAPSPADPLFDAGGGGHPHFIKNETSVSRVGNTLVTNFKEAGLAAGSVETVQLSAIGTATYLCINNGGHNPSAANKRTVSQQLTTSGQFTADQNGNIVGSLTLSPPGPGDFTCPPGQTMSGPQNVSYTNIMLTDLTSGATFTF